MRRYVIVGSGVAGLSAAESIRQQDPGGNLTIVGDDPHGYYSRPGLAYYLNRTIPEQQLFPRPASELHQLIPNRIHGRVTHILSEQHEIILAGGRHLAYDRLLLATGSRPAPADFPGNELHGIVTLFTLEDVRCIHKLVKQGKTAVVVGGGIIAVELAEGLAAHGVQVHYFLRGDRFWAKVLDETESRLVEQGLEHMGIQLHHRTQVAQTLSSRGVLTGIVTKTGKTLPCRLLGVAIGVVPQVELAEQAGLAIDRGILVDEYLASSAEDVFAAGDVARVRDPLTGGTWLETLWPTARRQGQIAGSNMAGAHIVCTREVPCNTVRIGDIITTTMGALEQRGDAGILTVATNGRASGQVVRPAWEVAHDDRTNRVRILVGERAIVGAVVMGDQTITQPLFQMIRTETDISPIRPMLVTRPESGIEMIAAFYQQTQNIHVHT
ncbi:MAG: hypothetical protein DPW09_01465 [Anaerolineae bacterium]|nr:hypothetical protein [Anaerolineae bacterium]